MCIRDSRIIVQSRDVNPSDNLTLQDGPSQSLLAAGLKTEVELETILNTPHLSNGTYWYNTPGQSRGFSKSPLINQDSCDWNEDLRTQPFAMYRLCWHRQDGYWAVDGYRMGTFENYSSLERRIYTSNNPSYFPLGPQINVATDTITNGGWSLCYSGSYVDYISDSDISGCSGTYILYYAQKVS